MTEAIPGEKRDQLIVKIILIVLVIYNLIFLASEFYPEKVQFITNEIYKVVLENRVMITFLEFLGVAVVFVDLIIGYDKKPKPGKYLRLAITAFIVLMFILKIFMTYLKAFSETGSQA